MYGQRILDGGFYRDGMGWDGMGDGDFESIKYRGYYPYTVERRGCGGIYKNLVASGREWIPRRGWRLFEGEVLFLYKHKRIAITREKIPKKRFAPSFGCSNRISLILILIYFSESMSSSSWLFILVVDDT